VTHPLAREISADAPGAPLDPSRTCAIGQCGLVWVEGPDAVTFLQGLVTCNVADITVGDGRLGLLLDAKGHITTQLQIVRDDLQGFTLITDPTAAPRLAEDLDRFHFSEDLEILGPEISALVTIADGIDPPALAISAPGWIPGTRVAVVDDGAEAAAEGGWQPASEDALEVLRITAGVARVGVDTGPKTLVQEVLLEDRVVDFSKGCYLGQETVARAQHRGQVNRILRGLIAAAPMVRGAEVRFGDRVLGTITSVAIHPTLGAIAMGVLRREIPDGATVRVGPDGIPATLHAFPLR
jgi:folate-binding protein YgfZ